MYIYKNVFVIVFHVVVVGSWSKGLICGFLFYRLVCDLTSSTRISTSKTTFQHTYMISSVRIRAFPRLTSRCLKPITPLISLRRNVSNEGSSADQRKIVDLLMKSSKIEFSKHSQVEFDDFDRSFVANEAIGLPEIRIPSEPFPPVVFEEYDGPDMENLGGLYLKYITVKYIFSTRPHLKFYDAFEHADVLVNHAAREFEYRHGSSFFEYIGQFCLIDMAECNLFMKRFFVEDNKSSELIEPFYSYFMKISPNFKRNRIDYNLIWGSSSPNSIFEFPQLESPTNSFNPLYLVDPSNVPKLLGSPIFNERHNAELIVPKLEDLQNYGKLVFEFYTVNALFRKLDTSNPLFSQIIKNIDCAFEDIIKYSEITKVLNPSDYGFVFKDIRGSKCNEIFYQYVGILDIANSEDENMVHTWVDKLVDYFIKNARNNEASFEIRNDLPTSLELRFRKEKYLPVVPCLELNNGIEEKIFPHGYPDSSKIEEIAKLGQNIILLAFKLYLGLKRLGVAEHEKYKYEKEYSGVIISHINESIKVKSITPAVYQDLDIPYTPYQFLGLYLLSDFDGCMEFLSQFIDEAANTGNFELSTNYMKWLIYKSNTPLLRMNNTLIPKSTTPLNLPPLADDSRITRLMLLNNSVIKPTYGAYKNNSWKRNNLLKNCLHSWHNLGNLVYKVSLEHALMVKLSQASSPYVRELFKLLTSSNFCKSLLDNSGIFAKLNNHEYESLLIEKRYANSLINAEFSQYIAALYISDPMIIRKWTESLAQLFINLIENLNHEEILHLINSFTGELRTHKLSLCAKFTNRIVTDILKDKISIDLPPVLEDTNGLSKDCLEEVGKGFLGYVVSSFNVHYGLDSFINAKSDILEIIDGVFETDKMQEKLDNKSIYEYIGLLTYQEGNDATEAFLRKLIEDLMNYQFKRLDASKIPTLNLKFKNTQANSKFFIWDDKIRLPEVVNISPLHTLLLVNFYVSRNFLKYTNSHRENINELPDICTKFNTIGGDFYKYLVSKHSYGWNKTQDPLPMEIIERTMKLLLDRVFMSIVCFKSGILYDPFGLKEYSKLAKKAMKNNFYFLRFSGQSFRQYLGSLCYHDIEQADEWVAKLVSSILNELASTSVEGQHNILNDLESDLNAYYIHKRI